MLRPDFLQDASIKRWLAGMDPVWTLLGRESLTALYSRPSAGDGAIQLASDLSDGELNQSAIARNAIILLRAAANDQGLKLTATGNLTRQVVAQMIELFVWPDFDKDKAFVLHKVINEPDFLPLFFTRHLVQFGRLIKPRKDYLRATPAGRDMLATGGAQSLQAQLFNLAFWSLDLSYLSRGRHDGWPQKDIGVILWSLSIAANEWRTREQLTRMCSVPNAAIVTSDFDLGTYAVDGMVLRPLLWFGLLEHRSEETPDQKFVKQHFYRKTPLFDRFLSFDIRVNVPSNQRH